MSNIAERYINVTINRDTAPTARTSFAKVLFIAEADTVSTSDRIVWFADLESVATAGFATDSPAYLAAQAYFTQDGFAEGLYIGLKADAETYAEALDAMRLIKDDFYAITFESISTADIQAVATYAAAANRPMLAIARASLAAVIDGTATNDVASLIKATGNERAALIWHDDAYNADFNSDGVFPDLALAARVIPLPETNDFAPGAVPWDKQPIKGIVGNELTSAQRTALADKNVMHLQTDGISVTVNSGKVLGGEWADVIHGTDWLEARITEDVHAMLKRNAEIFKKVSYTNQGIAQVKASIDARLSNAVSTGLILDGYKTTVPKRSETSATDRANRTLTNVRFEAELQGAIQSVNIIGNVTIKG